MRTVGRGPRRGRAPRRRPQVAPGACDGAMKVQRGQTLDPGRPVLPSRRDTRGGWRVGWGAAQPVTDP